jgi:hypothetical protein
MSTLRIVHPPHPAKPVRPQLAQQVDDLHELRGLIRKSQEAERILTQQVLGTLTAAELDTFEGSQAVAIVGQRVTLAPDPQLFLEALGPRAWEALTVNVTAARRLLGADDLAAISESTTSRVLRVEAVEERT